MRSRTTRLIILITSILIAIIMGMQVHWLNRTYAYEKNEFNTSVLKAIRGVYEDLPLLYNVSIPLDSLVEKNSSSAFLFRIDNIPEKDSLLSTLASELEDFHVFTDYKVAVYDAPGGKYLFQEYFSADASDKNEDPSLKLPVLKRKFNYVYLNFPDRKNYIINEMKTWIFASAVLLFVLVCFSFAIYYFLKQKFLMEIQTDFINNVTHEFSTPLSVIDLSVEGLGKPAITNQPDKFDKYLAAIKFQSEYLKKHIANLVGTVIAGNYHFALKKTGVVPNEMLKKAVAQLEPLLTKKNGAVEWYLEEKNTLILADEENLYLAFFNIINNAIKYSAFPQIIITTSVQDQKYFVSIRDNGIGIDSSLINNIFKKFYRVQDGNVHNVKGLGLGLYFAKKVIDGHQGKIVVNSIPGTGTEFRIELPLNKN